MQDTFSYLAEKCYPAFGRYAKKIAPYFSQLDPLLKKAEIKCTVEEYLSIAIFICILDFIIEIPILIFIFSAFFPIGLAIILGILSSAILTAAIFFLFIAYPTTIISNKSYKIETGLHYSIAYMAAVAASDAPPSLIFKTISEMKDYPELANEMKKLVRDIDAFGMDLLSALKREAERTPSKKLRELLLSMETVVRSGGSLAEFLRAKARDATLEYKRRIREFSSNLSMLSEIYITAVIVGPIFFTVLSSVMVGMGGGGFSTVILQFMLMFFIIPIISIILAYYIHITTP